MDNFDFDFDITSIPQETIDKVKNDAASLSKDFRQIYIGNTLYQYIYQKEQEERKKQEIQDFVNAFDPNSVISFLFDNI